MILTAGKANSNEVYGSKREKVAKLLLRGMSNHEIAAELGIQEKTVRWHLTWVYRKAGVKSCRQYMAKELT